MWFEELTGFKERSSENVRENLRIEADTIYSKVNGKRYAHGELQVPTLSELRKSSPALNDFNGKISISEMVYDVTELHCDIENSGALFQAASQFNLLEMINPDVSPEQGIDRYDYDHTQGPACAIACGAGTIYRNYFVRVNSQIGQTTENQINCLNLIGSELQNDQLNLWEMRNGYAIINEEALLTINKKIAGLSDKGRESLKGKLRVGIQWNTEVTKSDTKHKVSQIYCSALPVAYCDPETNLWEPFSRIILEATYEATLYTALINLEKNNSNLVYLTLVGGGAFGNEEHWILESIQKVVRKFRNAPLDIKIVSYGRSNKNLIQSINEI